MKIDEQRQAILEKQKELFCEWCPNDCREREKDKLTDEERAGCVASGGFAEESVKEMAEMGAVLKVEGALPEVDDAYKDFGGNDSIWEDSQQAMVDAGYSLFAPLIEPEAPPR